MTPTSLNREITDCRACPRLVEHREKVALVRTKRFEGEDYWGRAVPSFGDAKARMLIVGLAPAAHGANRTGRMFTGDRSGDWLFEALHRFDFANQPTSRDRKDGLELRDAFITAVAHCAPPANKPSKEEIQRCGDYLVRELRALPRLRVVVALGKVAFDGFLAGWRRAGREIPRPRPEFAHGSRALLSMDVELLGSYHPSQQNTFTRKLTRAMFHRVFRRARRRLDATPLDLVSATHHQAHPSSGPNSYPTQPDSA